MTQQLIPYEPAQAQSLDLMTLGKVLSSSGYFQDAKDAAQAIVKVLAGRELGIGDIAAMTGLYIVKGRVTMSANLMAAQIKRSGKYNYQIGRLDDTGCEIVFFEQGREIGRSSFTADDAKAAGLWGSSDPWKKTPRNMLFARAMSNGAKWYTPDVFSSPVYTPDELSSEPAPVAVLPPAPAADPVTGEVIESPTLPTNGKKSRREMLIERIAELTEQAGKMDLEITLAKPLDEMTEAELTQHGKNLKAAIAAAELTPAT